MSNTIAFIHGTQKLHTRSSDRCWTRRTSKPKVYRRRRSLTNTTTIEINNESSQGGSCTWVDLIGGLSNEGGTIENDDEDV
ncbi:hypothetical protein L596_005401 [Steinernema carpocapsae]|uniref:Uncharacterized protein n=1 Tax=Steinernema carpocapsae TaxID=34508 RepID=A0A4U8V3K6_STECR|nr:hypothetical protein L596_005401 [Steinernema carpocapsae]